MRLFPWVASGDRNGEKSIETKALVDTGAFYSWAPASVLRKLGVKPIRTEAGELANGAIIIKEVGQIEVEVQGRRIFTLILFGDEGTTPLLGAYTLEGLGFDASPKRKRLVPIKVIPIK